MLARDWHRRLLSRTIRPMTDAAKKLLSQALSLSTEEQRWLTERLVDAASTTEDEVRRAWNKVAAERLERAARGELKLVSHEDVQAHARELLVDR